MKLEEHLREFLDGSIDAAEARELAVAAVAGNLRQIKLGIAERLWLARQPGTDDAKASAAHLGAARSLKLRYDAARAEYDRLNGLPVSGPELHVVEGGHPDMPGTPGTSGGVA